ncbi:MAG: hypothetical protein JXA33_17860 [Anaerolineae bacterium]|nr:hypothetical protein [Anaerolineae bacterium]
MDKRKFEPEPDNVLPRVRLTPCPNCGGEMHHGSLRIAGQLDSQVFVEDRSCEEEEYQSLDVWVCSECGYVELHTLPSRNYCRKAKV